MNFENSPDWQRYLAACHAMQTGVAHTQARGSNDGSPKHLRVGINSAMVDSAALVKLLVAKGVITMEEYIHILAEQMEEEVAKYEQELGPNITLA